MIRWMQLFVGILASIGIAHGLDITVKGGTIYKDALIVGVENHQVLIWHAKGEVVIPCANLPEDLQKQYNDPSLLQLPDPLVLEDGTSLKQAVLNGFDQEGLSIRHSTGTGRVTYARLPKAVRIRFPFTDATRIQYKAMMAEHLGPDGPTISTNGIAQVQSYYRDAAKTEGLRGAADKDGEMVYHPAGGGASAAPSAGGSVYVHGYTRRNGTSVAPYTRRR